MRSTKVGNLPAVVLDKSYLRAASKADVVDLCNSDKVLMIEDLFFELMTGDSVTRARSFDKFPRRENPVALMPTIGELFGREVDRRRPVTPVWDHRRRLTFTFNEALTREDFGLTPEQATGVSVWEDQVEESVEDFLQGVGTADRLFPPLEGLRPGAHPDRIAEVVERIASDIEAIRGLYDAFKPEGFPPSAIVGRTWAVFRWLQAHLLASVEFFAKFGVGINPTHPKRLENERIDVNYLVIAVLACGLATGDRQMARRFMLLCPEGRLITVPEERDV